jgi:hypothetical protein
MTALPARFRAFVAEKVDDRVERAIRELGPDDLPPGQVSIRSLFRLLPFADGTH